MQLYVRDALESDVVAVVDLLIAGKLVGRTGPDTLDERYRNDYIDAFREIDRTEGSYLLVGEFAGDVVASLQLITFRHLQHRGGRCAEIESMHVAEGHRSQGIGQQMLDHAVSRAKDMGCYRIQLTSNADRPEAHRFYEANGFAPTHQGYKQYLDLDWTPHRSAGRREAIANVSN